MEGKALAKGSATRTANKHKRREHILICAGEMIAEEGLDALTLARLAERAGVTVPTIHNLIGKKSDIYETLVEESMSRALEVGLKIDRTDPITAVETLADNLLGLLATNEQYFKGAFIAGERIKYFGQDEISGIIPRAIKLSRLICAEAVKAGQLEGRIDTDLLGDRWFASNRLARQDWMNGYITLDAYRSQLVTGMFVTLCADAAPAFKDRLLAKIEALYADAEM